MKHAFLIIAHGCYDILYTLLESLDDSRNDIYLHIDAKSQDLYNRISQWHPKKATLDLLSHRLDVRWGDISQVEVELLLMKTAYERGPYHHYHLLSGTDLPIKSQDYIHHFFDKHVNVEFISYWESDEHQRDVYKKVSRYYLFTKHLKDKTTVKYHWAVFIRNLILGLQKLTRYRRLGSYSFHKGSNWFSITHACCEYLIKNSPKYLKRLKYTLCPDEIWIQTMIWNSPFKSKVYEVNNMHKVDIRLIDWQRGSPYVWKDSDWHELENSQCLFARKFSIETPILLNKIKSINKTEIQDISSKKICSTNSNF